MTLTKEKIQKNAEKFFKTGQDYNFINDKLIDLIGKSIIGAPASSSKNLHNAFEGGLIDHIFKVTKHAVSVNELLPAEKQIEKASLVKVCFLHQIGKSELYIENTEEWKLKRGNFYDFNEELVSMRPSERSIYYATSCGVELSETEFQAIINYDKDDSDKAAKWHTETLGELLKIGNILAMIEEK